MMMTMMTNDDSDEDDDEDSHDDDDDDDDVDAGVGVDVDDDVDGDVVMSGVQFSIEFPGKAWQMLGVSVDDVKYWAQRYGDNFCLLDDAGLTAQWWHSTSHPFHSFLQFSELSLVISHFILGSGICWDILRP